MTPVILDGSNLSLWGQREKRNIRTLGALLPCLRALVDKGIEAYVIFDASFRHRIDKKSRAAADFERLLREDEKFQIAPAGTPADAFILQFAALRSFGVVSNDTFRDYLERRGKNKPGEFDGKPVQLHSFQMLMGGLVIPSLRISYLIDESSLDVAALIKARDGHAVPAPPPPPPPPPRPRPVEQPQPKTAPAPADNRQSQPGVLDDLLELSPLVLRAEDVFEIYRKRTGKPWKGRSSHKGAEQFATECFGRPAGYRDVEGRKKNDGYFFDPEFDGPEHQAVRASLLASQSKVIPLIASARTRLMPILDLIHDPGIASGFTMDRLCAQAEAAKICYYERYLRAMLYALVAVNGVLGANEEETDISEILKGTMRVNPDESQTDRLNFLQRGILYLLSDRDNRLPDLFLAQMGWMFQLPRTPKIRQSIVRAHLDWLASV